jgi:peptidoglycan hydrolase-like protein with peptidoglycan-binding domain
MTGDGAGSAARLGRPAGDGPELVSVLAEQLLANGRTAGAAPAGTVAAGDAGVSFAPAPRHDAGERRGSAPGSPAPDRRAPSPSAPASRAGSTAGGHAYLVPRPASPLVDRLPGQANWPLRIKAASLGLLLLVTSANTLLDFPWLDGFATPVATTSRWPIVREGRAGTAVRTVQYLLAARGHRLAIDGVFGPETEREVRRFQTARGLRVDGIVGPQTWSALAVTMERGIEGYSVRAVQAELTSSGLPTEVDGIFGPITQGNVRAFQRRNGLSATGRVNAATWNALARARPRDPRGIGFEAPAPMPKPNGTTRARGGSQPDRGGRGDDVQDTVVRLPATP